MALRRQVIVITGASSGLGEGMARIFASMGRDVALCARRGDALIRLRDELSQRHPQQHFEARTLDVTQATDVAQVFLDLHRTYGQIDRVIVNAGRGGAHRIGEGDVNESMAVAQTNVLGAIAQCDAAMRIFRRQGHGHLVTLSSVSAVRGMPGPMAVYSASKAAVATLSQALRNELQTTGSAIRVTTLMPGFIHTALNAHQAKKPFAVDVHTGCLALVRAIEREPASASVPAWPWTLIVHVLRWLPARWLPGAGTPSSPHPKSP